MVSLEWKHSCAIHLRGQTVLPQEIRLEIGLCSAVWSQYIEMSNRLCEKLLILEVKNSLFLKHGLPIPSSCKRLLKAFFTPALGAEKPISLKTNKQRKQQKTSNPYGYIPVLHLNGAVVSHLSFAIDVMVGVACSRARWSLAETYTSLTCW